MAELDHFQEYRTLIEDTSKLSDRRQTINDILVGINALFLTGLAYLVVNSHLSSWWIPQVLGAVAVITLPINLTWRALNIRYRNLVRIRINYLTKIEDKLRLLSGEPDFGVYHEEAVQLYPKPQGNTGFSQLEMHLILFFTFLYPIIAIAVTVISLLVQQNILPAVKWN